MANTPKVTRIHKSLNRRYGNIDVITLSKYGHGVGIGYSYDARNSCLKLVKVMVGCFRIWMRLIILRPRSVYAINPPAGAITLLYHIVCGGEYCYESLEIWAGSSSRVYTHPVWRKAFYWVERVVAQRATYFIMTDQFRMRFLRRYYRIPRHKCVYLYNTGINEDDVSVITPVEYAHPVVSYCGLLMRGRGIVEIVKGFALSGIGGTLLLVGECDSRYRAELQEIVDSCGIGDRVVFSGKVPHSEMINAMQRSDITFALYERSCVNNRLCSPNKFFDAIGAGVKLITVRCYLARFLRAQGAAIYSVESVAVGDITRALRECGSGRVSAGTTEDLRKLFDWRNEEGKLLKLL